ncbi:MAG: 4a-hydroxytetrahydrobiopterin dehydratase [Syntrophaceae bacterium]
MGIANEHCRSVLAGERPLGEDQAKELARQVPEWKISAGVLNREYKFGDFFLALAFVNRVAATAVNEDHYPDIFMSSGKVKLTFSTGKVGGLSRNDFIMAAKSDCIY